MLTLEFSKNSTHKWKAREKSIQNSKVTQEFHIIISLKFKYKLAKMRLQTHIPC